MELKPIMLLMLPHWKMISSEMLDQVAIWARESFPKYYVLVMTSTEIEETVVEISSWKSLSYLNYATLLKMIDEDKWEKEAKDYPKLTSAIKEVSNNNFKQLGKWQKEHPNCYNPDSKDNDTFLSIINHSMAGGDQEESNKNIGKVVTTIAKETTIDKEEAIPNTNEQAITKKKSKPTFMTPKDNDEFMSILYKSNNQPIIIPK